GAAASAAPVAPPTVESRPAAPTAPPARAAAPSNAEAQRHAAPSNAEAQRHVAPSHAEAPRHAEQAPAPVRSHPNDQAAPHALASVPSVAGGASGQVLANAEDWLSLVASVGLKGPVRELAAHSAFCGHRDGVLQLSLPDSFDHLRSEGLVRQLAQALSGPLGAPPQIRFESARANAGDTLHARTERERGQRQSEAESAFLSDPVVSRLVGQGATVLTESIRPLDDH
ncbi:MAG TPA: DNA polymerase III subunit gamma/tau, partial [Arenimonas sp.]|uniref:DNA polymerase III subunit gamma/tau C-terminal domain-containing protein n=1 Tax=Arenimonas sp. TaxID=1872635 RepID=UPI002D906A4D|nr:DNA polymerase III subunit gamma/tau [Arenimonas sp.]